MPAFSGTLRSNEIFAALYNMIISQEVFADNLSGTYSELVDMARVDGSLYGDTKLYYSTDVLKSVEWGADDEALNLLALHRPPAPACQAIILDKFRQISLTVDNYLSKRAWGTEGAFSSFNGVMLGWIRETKRVYDSLTYNVFVCQKDAENGQLSAFTNDYTLPSDPTPDQIEAYNRLTAQGIAKHIADLVVDMKRPSRKYNKYGYLRSYNKDDLIVVWNADWVNKIINIDLPTIYHKDGLFDFKYVLPAEYFGDGITESEGAAGLNAHSAIEQDINGTHYFPGDKIEADDAADSAGAEVYTPNANIICKIYTKLPPYMSAFEVGTSFFNPKSLTENHYLTWGHNTLEALYNYPNITVTNGDA